MELHTQIRRFLKKSQLTFEALPDQLIDWQSFITLVSRRQKESEEELYLLERSMNLSSSEMEEINQMLAEAQRIIKMSHWKYDKLENRFDWSTELSYLLGCSENNCILSSFEAFVALLHEDDKEKFLEYFQKALNSLESVEVNIRLGMETQAYCWFKMVSRSKEEMGDQDQFITGVLININQQMMSENEIRELNKQLLSAVEKVNLSAGVANTMLGSVNNVLDDISECTDLVKKSYSDSNLSNLLIVKESIQSHLDDLPRYLTEDERGRLIPSYLISCIEQLIRSDMTVRQEVNRLSDSIQHIRDIVMMSRTLNGGSDSRERYFLPELIDDAIYLCDLNFLKEKKIQIKKNYQFTPFLMIDRGKLLKILINLIQNSKAALMEYRLNLHKTIDIQIEESDEDRKVKIIIGDNGVGISAENMGKIFNPGFTTKKNGQGQSLYSCLICAKELGGSIKASSEGELKGAQFILTLPLE